MEKLLIEIILKIQTEKQDARKQPEHALMKEIWSELLQRMEIELELMYQDSKLDKRKSINFVMFRLNDK